LTTAKRQFPFAYVKWKFFLRPTPLSIYVLSYDILPSQIQSELLKGLVGLWPVLFMIVIVSQKSSAEKRLEDMVKSMRRMALPVTCHGTFIQRRFKSIRLSQKKGWRPLAAIPD
jgi:hypothetical protein